MQKLNKGLFRSASTKYKSFDSFSMNSGDTGGQGSQVQVDAMPSLAMIYKKVEEKKNTNEEYLFRRFDEEFTKVTPQLVKQILLKYYRILIKAAGKLFLVFMRLYQEYIFLLILYFAF